MIEEWLTDENVVEGNACGRKSMEWQSPATCQAPRRWPMRVSFTKSSIKVFDPGLSVTPIMCHLECMAGRWSVPVGRLHVLAYVRLTLAINRIK